MVSELPDGCITSWTSPKQLSLSNLRAALTMNGFDKDLAKDMAPRSAFARAAKQLDDDRIIRKIDEDEDDLRFQFTKEHLEKGELRYEREFMLTLSKKTGEVECENAAMQQEAQRLVDHHIATREASDITRLVQKIFESKGGDLIPIRAQGGCYFVPPQHSEVVTKVKDLLDAIGGKLNVWEISMKSEATQAAVSEATLTHMLSEVEEFNESLQSIDQESKPHVVQRRYDKIALLRTKLEGYAPLLQGLYGEIAGAIQGANELLNRKITGDFEVGAEVVAEPEVTSEELDQLIESLAPEAPDGLEFDRMLPTLPPPPPVDLSEIDRLLSQGLPPLPQ